MFRSPAQAPVGDHLVLEPESATYRIPVRIACSNFSRLPHRTMHTCFLGEQVVLFLELQLPTGLVYRYRIVRTFFVIIRKLDRYQSHVARGTLPNPFSYNPDMR